MKPLGPLFVLAALDLARAADDAARPRPASPGDKLTPARSGEEIAAAWRRWALADPSHPRPSRRGLSLPAPRPGA